MSPSSFPMKMALPCLTISVSETGSSGSRIKCPLPSLDGPRASLTSFDIPPLPAPLDAAWAILKCTGMLTWTEKLRLGWGLLPAYLQGQPYVESQESATVEEWMQQRSIPQSVVDEVFVAMSKALGFVGPERLSMHCVLIALSRFLQESTGSRIAVLDGSPTERLCEHLRDYIDAGGGEVRVNAAVERFLLNADDTVAGVLLADGSVVSGDAYVNARLVDALKKLTPGPWRKHDYFRNLSALRGVPVMNLHLWFDRKLSTVDNLIFSRSPILSVYADIVKLMPMTSDPCCHWSWRQPPSTGPSQMKRFRPQRWRNWSNTFPRKSKPMVAWPK